MTHQSKENKHTNYNKKRGSTPLRVQLTPSDNAELWEEIKSDLNNKSGNAKLGILELWRYAKKNGYFDH
ncbi:hypothetical protein [Thalassotalea marina]|uniref:Uncharacterized protein n=1 Tax=Thalassotalea marina TaxID=1673741 RepID=A0A919BS90_9GAMM|nr:hypothetical protein [Thalassotalea marina]GHG07940.1 hypothetical protein GCM10017161_42160 [Thalassotalea marina]